MSKSSLLKKSKSSLPTRGAWIEITYLTAAKAKGKSRSPHGERGLKSERQPGKQPQCQSLPTRGAWIEILDSIPTAASITQSLPTRGAWIEI